MSIIISQYGVTLSARNGHAQHENHADHTHQTKHVRDFGEELKAMGFKVSYEDERLSSKTARQSLISENIKTGHNKQLVDQRAAAIILQQYIDKLK